MFLGWRERAVDKKACELGGALLATVKCRNIDCRCANERAQRHAVCGGLPPHCSFYSTNVRDCLFGIEDVPAAALEELHRTALAIPHTESTTHENRAHIVARRKNRCKIEISDCTKMHFASMQPAYARKMPENMYTRFPSPSSSRDDLISLEIRR
ncbi:hypothetical protein BST61_g10232 [Cercospora zeina]